MSVEAVAKARLEINRAATNFALNNPDFTLVELLEHMRDNAQPLDPAVAAAWFRNTFMPNTVSAFARGDVEAAWQTGQDERGARTYSLAAHPIVEAEPEPATVEAVELPEVTVEVSPYAELESAATHVVSEVLGGAPHYAASRDALAEALREHFAFSAGSAEGLLSYLHERGQLSTYSFGDTFFTTLPGLERTSEQVERPKPGEQEESVPVGDEAFTHEELELAERVLDDLQDLVKANQYTQRTKMRRRLKVQQNPTEFRDFVRRLQTRGIVEQGILKTRDRGRIPFVKWRSSENRQAWIQNRAGVLRSLREAYVVPEESLE